MNEHAATTTGKDATSVDVGFCFLDDATTSDPDKSSKTMRRYHQLLWSKPLPSGALFDLDTTTHREYLHHRSDLGEFFLGSDSVVPTYDYWQRTATLFESVPHEGRGEFHRLTYTIGGAMVFPSNQVDRKPTINAARGMNVARIGDRMDLTLECIRRHYLGADNPLAVALNRYRNFFQLFEDFNGYVDFFHLGDLLGAHGAIQFFLPFDDFKSHAVPLDPDAYAGYRANSMEFITARNARIKDWSDRTLPAGRV